MKKRAAFLMCVLLSSLAWADRTAKWEYIGEHPLGKMYMDTANIERGQGTVTYWGKRNYFKPQHAPDFKFDYDEQRVLQRVDCAKKEVTLAHMHFYNKGQKVMELRDLNHGPKAITDDGFIIKGYNRFCDPPKQEKSAKGTW